MDAHSWYINISTSLDTLRNGQTGYYFADDIFKLFFIERNMCILIQISLILVPNTAQTIIHCWWHNLKTMNDMLKPKTLMTKIHDTVDHSE